MLVKTRHDDVSVLTSELPRGVEVRTLASLRERGGAVGPVRPDVHSLVTLTAGALAPSVDFVEHPITPGHWLWARPGQVRQWGELSGAEGVMVRFPTASLDPDTAIEVCADDPHAPAVRVPDAHDHAIVRVAATQLQWEHDAAGEADTRAQILRHLLAVLVLRVAALPALGGLSSEPTEVYLAFRDAVERDFANTRRLGDYAETLAYSPRTLSRSTLAAAGIGAKEFIDRRVVLEAKRRLACADEAAASIGAGLGFSSATNFNKFFHQRTGTTPIGFRSAVRGERLLP